ncbi:MAG: hypothetical protein SFU86_19620 [Pirellulaceae bacterium]|nr:hypothetical protein [Pirellulaceae bacterium]
MKSPTPPKIKKFPPAKQKRMDELLDKNSEGTITPDERTLLEGLVADAEKLMVANAKLLVRFSQQGPVAPAGAIPVTIWVQPSAAGQ